MEETTTKKLEYQLSYTGKGGDFFSIIIVNWLLTLITLGLYYPWAKAKQLNYLYGETHLMVTHSRFMVQEKKCLKVLSKPYLSSEHFMGCYFYLFT